MFKAIGRQGTAVDNRRRNKKERKEKGRKNKAKTKKEKISESV
jgi:hypothetical protein